MLKKNHIARLFFKRQNSPKQDSDNLTAMLLPSMLGILLCSICLAGSTWAWFTASQTVATQTITTANYAVVVSACSEETSVIVENPTTLERGTYTVTITAVGDANTGYCIVKTGNTERQTCQFPTADNPEKSISFTLILTESAAIEITPCWGTSVTENSHRIGSGDTYTPDLTMAG